MRSRRQAVSDTVGTLSMDPWNDDRVRDFVAINTIQRLRAYHLPTSAPMPVIDEVNTARALNLILLPRADPDYRPCLGEQPPSRTQLRARRRATARQERRERRQRQQEGAGRGGQGGCSPESPSTTASTSSSSDDGSNVDDDTAIEHGATLSMTNSSFSTDIATPTKPARPRSPVASGAAPSRQCAIDRARSLFFGALSFTSSTSPRRLVNSPHAPLTPSIASTTTIAGRSSMHVPRSPKEAFLSTTASPLSSDARAGQRRAGREVAAAATEEGLVTAMPTAPPALSATRSLGMELDAYIEANSTPLRPPPPMRYVGVSAEAQTPVSAEANASESDVSANSSAVVGSHDASKSEADALCESTPTKTTPAAARPPSPRLVRAEGGRTTTPPPSHGGGGRRSSSTDIMHTCDVCDAIIQYYQSMLTRGVVLDRYNHKDLAFVWWVLGRNMDVAALENRGPMRREALMITLRNFYYTLLTAEEARAKVAAGEAEKSHAEKKELAGTGVPAASAAPGVQMTLPRSADAAATGDQQAEAADTEEHSRCTSGKAAESSDNTADALADASVLRRSPRARSRGSHTASASAASAASGRQRDSLRAARTASGTAALKRSRLDTPLVSSGSDDEERDDEHLVEEDVGDGADEQERLSVTPSRGRTSVPSPHKKLPHKEGTTLTARRRAVADGALGSSSSATGKGIAAALLAEDEETVMDVVAEGVDDALDKEADTLHSQTESSVVSRAGSVAQSSTGEICRHHRRAAERSKAVEETWVSTRTGRRAAAVKAAAQLVHQGAADAMAHRKSTKAVPFTNASGTSRTAASKTLKQEASTTAAAKDAGATAVAVIPSAPAGGSATSKLQPKRRTGSKRARSPSRETSPGEGHRGRSSDSGGDSDMELTKAEAKGSNTEAPRMVSRVSASKSKSRAAVFTKASAVKAERVTPIVHPLSGKPTAPPFDAPTTTIPGSVAAAATASKKGGRGEEHRGRPRGSFKIPRVDSSAREDQGNSLLASVTLSSQRRRDGGACSTAVFTGTSLETAAPHQRSDAVSMAVAPSSSSAPSKASEDAVPLKFPVYEMPLRLTPDQRAVRSRIQQRMGVPLPAPPPRSSAGSISYDSGIDAQWATVYSSYTFLLSSFRTATWTRISQGGGGHERRAITAPVLWYGQAISPVVAGRLTSTSSSGADHSRQVREKALAAMLSEDALVNGGAPSGAAAIATAAGTLTRQRGRKRRIEGGVDPSLRGNVLRHDQVALERLVKERVVQVAELRQAAVSRTVERGQGKCRASGSGTAQVKQEPRSGSEEEEKQDDEVHVLRAKPAVGLPMSPTGVSPAVAATTPLDPAKRAGEGADATAEEALAPEQRRDNSAQLPLLPQASAFGDLPYAQQCLLVWSAAGLLERHIHRLQMEDARRERLLARCGRMATRRMAARVAAVIQGGIADGNACDNAEDAAAQLAGELRGGDEDRDSGASREDSDAPEERTRSRILGLPSGTSRKADVEEHIDRLEHLSGRSASLRSPSAISSSASSEVRFHKSMRPLPRRVYDYWAAYRRAGDSG
ncbi:conserved hypothetical protein [Leishmania major strain Friedlin]|uniref:Uncharacterized protein n=1 Tax=Leishmania major TaxID=5664 RepID=Q4Q8X4_LEIMA|nr:conserved hypothetical protein [Leishmania major strain Friedlin]CAG9576543.1 hypothetical_protein_-_conserved [Leishmania major strain Friedlin]CAJ05538.1 conserved hypothetical protein [Leishmania major strain Friedlin]|eukprot:XP_001684224.1 conserved hypothetical protein [Leishmania major strain Friedlin]